ncbi:hypothetical protein [Halarchaeum acidiphilum]|uniref:hypothetical protein n=1 Tax=Halarchaeum acidiphilum TaxID=489138 RepID=UPI0011D1D2C1|nr:hypothetical protein [Halarchaeum acidiphilum]
MNDATVNAILAVVFVAAGLACFPAVTDYSTDTCWLFVASARSTSSPSVTGPFAGDLLPVVYDGAFHGIAPLIWDIYWFNPVGMTGLLAGPHRRYSYPREGDSELSCPETPQRFEMDVSNVLSLGVPILCI